MANSLTVAVTDPSGGNGFFGQGTISWDDGDAGIAWIEFTGFPLQADQVTDTGECGLSLQTSVEVVAVRVSPGSAGETPSRRSSLRRDRSRG